MMLLSREGIVNVVSGGGKGGKEGNVVEKIAIQ